MLVFFFQDLEGLTEVFGGMSAGMSGRKLPLWAEFSFLIPGPPKPERGYKKRNNGTKKPERGHKKSGTTVPKPRMRVHLPKPPFYETTLLFPLDLFPANLSIC